MVSIRNELTNYLSQGRGLCDCLMLKTPLRKMERSLAMPAVFLTLNLTAYALLVLFLFPLYPNIWMVYISATI